MIREKASKVYETCKTKKNSQLLADLTDKTFAIKVVMKWIMICVESKEMFT